MPARSNSLSSVTKRTALLFALLLLLGSIALAMYLSPAFYRSSSAGSTDTASTLPRTTQSTPLPRSQLQSLLSLQPEADRLRHRIGKRFLSGGLDVSITVGALTIGSSRHSVNIIRTQNADNESVAISIDGNPKLLTWDDKNGAKDEDRLAEGEQRALIERIALDSADQFILAQARGASYETIAQQVRPSEAGGGDGYTGPVWDLVRIAEPSSSNSKKPLSHWRLYYINSVTGLIEKTISQEGGQRIVSEISGWVDQGGEKFPTRYVWKLNNQTLITLSLTSVTFNAKR